jgi:hypothetical protein
VQYIRIMLNSSYGNVKIVFAKIIDISQHLSYMNIYSYFKGEKHGVRQGQAY